MIMISFVFSVLVFSEKTKAVWYAFEQVVTGAVFSFSDQKQCSREPRARTNITEATIVDQENNLELELRLRYYKVSNKVSRNRVYMTTDIICTKERKY